MKSNTKIHELFEIIFDLRKDMEKTQNLVSELNLDINEIQKEIKEADNIYSYNIKNIAEINENINIKIIDEN